MLTWLRKYSRDLDIELIGGRFMIQSIPKVVLEKSENRVLRDLDGWALEGVNCYWPTRLWHIQVLEEPANPDPLTITPPKLIALRGAGLVGDLGLFWPVEIWTWVSLLDLHSYICIFELWFLTFEFSFQNKKSPTWNQKDIWYIRYI